jgi:hypothetical protein
MPRCILRLHSNCWAEMSTLAASELAQEKRSPGLRDYPAAALKTVIGSTFAANAYGWLCYAFSEAPAF